MCLYPCTHYYFDERNLRQSVVFGCGRCIECLQDYQNQWKIRLSEEFAETCKGVFFTLTYEPLSAPPAVDPETGEILEEDEFSELSPLDPVPHSVSHSDIRSWLKRSRENLNLAKGSRQSFKYFITEEYGPTTLRPHAHGIIFGLSYDDVREFFLSPWEQRFGFTHSSKIDYDEASSHSPQRVANYVSKYCSKGNFENPRVSQGTVDKPRRFISHGIGKKYAERLKNDLLGDYKEVSLPRDGHDPFYQTYASQPLNTYRYLRGVASSQVCLDTNIPWFSLPRFFPPRIKHKPSVYNQWTTSSPASERVYIPLKEAFLSTLVDKLNCPYYDSKTQNTYVYKMPRYIKAKILGEKSALTHQIKEYLQTRSIELYREKFSELQTLHPDWTAPQTDSYLVRQENYRRQRRAERSRQNLARFYSLAKV